MNTKSIFLLSILLIGTQQIQLPFGGLSAFQLSIILVGVVGILSSLSKRSLPSGSPALFAILYLISGFVAYSLSLNPKAQSSFLLSIMTSMIVFFIPTFFKRTDVTLLLKTLIRSQYIAIPVGMFMWYANYRLGFFPQHIDLPLGLYIDFSDEAEIRAYAGSELRLFFPYATPPVLSIAMAMTVIMLFYAKELFSKNVRLFLLVTFTLLMILTGSRSGIFGLSLFVLTRFFTNRNHNKNKWGGVFVIVFLIAILYWSISEFTYMEKFVGRISNIGESDLKEDRHLLVPIEGLIIWISSLKNLILGIGFGSGYYMKGVFTEIPPHFLNSFVTLIAERGMMGLVLVCMLIRTTISLYKKESIMTNEERGLAFGLLVGMYSTLFYESIDCYYFIYIIAVAFMLDAKIKKSKFKVNYISN